jgi:malonate transporter and related proteins
MSAKIAQIFWIVLPVFGLIGLGYVSAWSGYLKQSIGEALGEFVFMVAVPILLFKTMATAEFPDASPWPLWISYFAGLAVAWPLADIIVRKLFGRDARVGVIAGVSAGFSNAVLLGIPLAYTAFGDAGLVPVLLVVAVQLPVLMVVSTVLIEWAGRRDGTVTGPVSASRTATSIALNLLKNPLVIGVVGGTAWRLLGFSYGGPLQILGDRLAVVAVPCALFALGMSLTQYGVRGHVLPAIFISGLKLIVKPAITFALAALVFDLPPLWVAVVTLVAACPTGVNAWLIANRFHTGHAVAANTITLTTGFSVLTLSVWIWLLGL